MLWFSLGLIRHSEVRYHVARWILRLVQILFLVGENMWEDSFKSDIQKEIEELVHDSNFRLLKLRLSDWNYVQKIDWFATGLGLLTSLSVPDIWFDKLMRNDQILLWSLDWRFSQLITKPSCTSRILARLYNGVISTHFGFRITISFSPRQMHAFCRFWF